VRAQVDPVVVRAGAGEVDVAVGLEVDRGGHGGFGEGGFLGGEEGGGGVWQDG
jgi:hypothetical protein